MQYEAAIELLEDYAGRPEQYWQPPSGSAEHRQVRKFKRVLRIATKSAGIGAASVLRQVVLLAETRADAGRPPPIYVMGLGGSGSHWLAEMLTGLVDAFDSGEVYLPAPLLSRMEDLPPGQQGFLVDCLFIIHALGQASDPQLSLDRLTSARAINSAAGSIRPRHKSWDQQSFVVHMLRDPREQVASVTFRKANYRQEVAPDASDDEYLVARAKGAVRNYNAWDDSPIGANFLCRYEELLDSTDTTLSRLMAALGETPDPERIAEVARRYDAASMQQGLVEPRGNFYLDDGQGSRREPNDRQRALLHSELVEVRSAARYPADDCLGQTFEMRTQAERKLRLPFGKDVVTLLVRSEGATAWQELDHTSSETTVPRGELVKLRVHESATPDVVRSLTSLPGEALDSLCLAGNMCLDDDLLGTLAEALHGLQELDLGRTAITTDGLAHLALLKALKGLSLLGTPASKDMSGAMYDRIPELTYCRVLF